MAKRRRQNPFLAKPPSTTYKGRQMSGVSSHPGFHTSENIDIVLPYAQAKAEQSPFFFEDYPVILGFDMEGLEYLADFDAVQMAESIRDNYEAVDGLSDFEAFMNGSEELSESGYDEHSPISNLLPGASGTNILFARESAYENAVSKFAGYVLSLVDESDQEEVFEALLNFDVSALPLAEALEQRRYLENVDEKRLKVVFYMRPVWELLQWPFWKSEQEKATVLFVDFLESHGWTVYTSSEVDDGELNQPELSEVWGHDEPGLLQYHGTSYQNLIAAAPWLKDNLPTPPSPFGRSIDFEEDALEFTRSMMPDFRIEYYKGHIEAAEPEDVEED